MSSDKKKADRTVDQLYGGLRGRYGETDPQANGYRYQGYFAAEQRTLLGLVNRAAKVIVDVGCGSGLMVNPLCDSERLVIGVDFNRDACQAAARNGLEVIRGDAFCLPFAQNSVDEIITCQFFNQQTTPSVRQFIAECGYALRPGGRLIMVWRNGTALIHRLALTGLSLADRFLGRPCFPHYNHSLAEVIEDARKNGLTLERQMVTFPTLGWASDDTDGVLAKIIGASAVCVVVKPGGATSRLESG